MAQQCDLIQGPGKSTYTFSVTFCFPRRASRRGGEQKAEDVWRKTYTLIYPDPLIDNDDTLTFGHSLEAAKFVQQTGLWLYQQILDYKNAS